MAIGVSSRILQLIGTLVLTRFIAPAEYDQILGASICVGVVGQFTSFSFGQYLIAKRAPPDVAFQAATLHVGMGLVSMVIVVAFSDPLGRWIDTPHMSDFVVGFAVANLIDRARNIPERVLMRDLNFRTIATVNGLGEILFTVTAVALAKFAHWGGDAIIAGTLVRASVTAVLFFAKAPRAEWLAPTRLRGDTVRALFDYGWPIMVGSLADKAASRCDSLLVSRLFLPGVMSQYNLAYSLAEMPVSHVAEHIAEVLMPSFSRMEPEHRRSSVVRAAALMVLVVAPLSVGLGAVAPTLVAAIFDDRWAGMAPILSLLGTLMVFHPLPWSAIAFLQAEQNTRLIMIMSFVHAAVVLTLVAVLGWAGGLLWACVGAGIGFGVYAVLTIVLAAYATGFSARAYLIGVTRPLLACVPMFLAVALLREGLAELGAPAIVSLIAEIIAGGVVYVGAAFVVAPAGCRELVALARRTLAKRPEPRS